MNQQVLAVILLAWFSLQTCSHNRTNDTVLPRIIVLTDINNVGGDPDDKQSMAHLLMLSRIFTIHTLIHCGSW